MSYPGDVHLIRSHRTKLLTTLRSHRTKLLTTPLYRLPLSPKPLKSLAESLRNRHGARTPPQPSPAGRGRLTRATGAPPIGASRMTADAEALRVGLGGVRGLVPRAGDGHATGRSRYGGSVPDRRRRNPQRHAAAAATRAAGRADPHGRPLPARSRRPARPRPAAAGGRTPSTQRRRRRRPRGANYRPPRCQPRRLPGAGAARLAGQLRHQIRTGVPENRPLGHG